MGGTTRVRRLYASYPEEVVKALMGRSAGGHSCPNSWKTCRNQMSERRQHRSGTNYPTCLVSFRLTAVTHSEALEPKLAMEDERWLEGVRQRYAAADISSFKAVNGWLVHQ